MVALRRAQRIMPRGFVQDEISLETNFSLGFGELLGGNSLIRLDLERD
jgi:hypothetical protein